MLLSIKNLHTNFHMHDGRVIRAVDGVDLEINKGEVVCLVGESGCGKSLTALSITKLLPSKTARIDRGEIIFNDRDLVKENESSLRMIRGAQISYIFQEPHSALNPVFTVGDQIAESLILHKGLSKNEAKSECIRLFNMCRIPQAQKRILAYPHELSGGMKQRVMIAMAISSGPQLIIADEPTTALDVTIQKSILDLLDTMRKEIGCALLFITHDLSIVERFGERLYVMYRGKIVESGRVEQVIKNPLHPYTKGLLACIPKPGESKKELFHIKGVVGEVRSDLTECRFYDRCYGRKDICREKEPVMREIEEGHFARCVLVQDQRPKTKDRRHVL